MAGGWMGKRLTKNMNRIRNEASDSTTSSEASGIYSPYNPNIKVDDPEMQSVMDAHPDYQGITDPRTGELLSPYKVNAPDMSHIQHVQPGQQFKDAVGNYDKLQDYAWSEGPSQWAQNQSKMVDLQDSMQRDAIGQNVGTQTAGALSMLGRTGGYDSGSRERIATSMRRQGMNDTQNLYRQTQMAKLGIGSQDESNKLGVRTALPGMGTQLDSYKTGLEEYNNSLDMQKAGVQLGVDQYNTANAINDRAGYNNFNQNLYSQQSNIWGNVQAAEAMGGGGGGGGGGVGDIANGVQDAVGNFVSPVVDKVQQHDPGTHVVKNYHTRPTWGRSSEDSAPGKTKDMLDPSNWY